MVTINFNLLGNVILTILGIVALLFLILLLKNVNALVKKSKECLIKILIILIK